MWKPIKVVVLTVVGIMSVLFFTGCSKEDVINKPLQVQSGKEFEGGKEAPTTTSKPIYQYSKEEVIEEVFPILQKFIDAQFAYAIGKDETPQWDQYLVKADTSLKENIDYAVCIDAKSSDQILSYTGYLKLDDIGISSVFFSDGTWKLHKIVEWQTIQRGKNVEDSFQSMGGWNYSFEVTKNEQGEWKIVSWRDDENITTVSWWHRFKHKDRCIKPRPLALRSSGYNAVAAVNYAKNYCCTPNPEWCDYTTTGGDCTNFVSQCLLAGGWMQKTGSGYCANDAWFHKGTGHCWNTPSEKNYSCSWTQARDLYRYLDQVQNVQSVWFGEFCIQARVGDLVQIKGNDGQIRHSAIVTKVDGSKVYITFRNGGGYLPQIDYPLSIFDDERIYYWYINGTNGVLT